MISGRGKTMLRLLTLFFVLTASGSTLAGTITVALYRLGNSSGPRMDAVRSTKTGHAKDDVIVYDKDGKHWVKAGSGGISTFSKAQRKKDEWVLEKGASYPETLKLVNDHGMHWSWESAMDMPLDDYKAALRTVGAHFKKAALAPPKAKAPVRGKAKKHGEGSHE